MARFHSIPLASALITQLVEPKHLSITSTSFAKANFLTAVKKTISDSINRWWI